MRTFLAPSRLIFGPLGLALVAAAMGMLTPVRADAHFILDKGPDGGTLQGEPACYSQQAADGTPEKSAPCGQDDTGITLVPTNIVTSFTPGADGTTTITFTTNEVVYHPGHYRVAIASDMASLPADPAVTPTTTTPTMACGTAAIETVAAGTIAADGVVADDVLDHSAQFTSPQSYTFKVPASVHCSPQCVLQVVEFMSDHELNPQGGCFYHHCANISIGSSASHADGGAEEPDAAIGASGSSSGVSASGSSSGSVSGTASSGSGMSGTASSGTSGLSGSGAGSTGAATGGSAGAGSVGAGGSSGSGSSGTTTSGATASGHSGSAAGPAGSSEGGGESSSSSGCTVAKGMAGGAAPGLRLGAFAFAALVLVRRRRALSRAAR